MGEQDELQLWGDETRLKQVLINLVKNALKFTPSGLIAVELSYDANTKLLNGSVRDTGKGIHPDELPKLFSRFGKLSRTAEMNHEGIGLGLTIVKQIIHQYNGTVQVESAGVNKGSTFSFTMEMGLAPVAVSESVSVNSDDIEPLSPM